METTKRKSQTNKETVGTYTVRFKYFKFNPKLATTKWQSDVRPVITHAPEVKEAVKPNPDEHLDAASDTCSEVSDLDDLYIDVEDLPTPTSSTSKPPQQRRRCKKSSPCPICGKLVNDLKSHSQIHSGERTFPCSFCEKSFTNRGDLSQHENIHRGVKPFRCDVCPAAFAHRKTLQTHMVTHTKLRKYRCDICGKRYGHLTLLNRHLASQHRDDRRFKCSVCDKAFLTKQVLQNHMLTHSAERPHRCQHCLKSFRRADSLQAHLKTHPRDLPTKEDDLSEALEQFSAVAVDDPVEGFNCLPDGIVYDALDLPFSI